MPFSREGSKLTPIAPRGGGGGGFFHSKGTWGCAALKGILFRTASLAKGMLFGNFSLCQSRQGYNFWQFSFRKGKIFLICVQKPKILAILVQRRRNFGDLCLENGKLWHFWSRNQSSQGYHFHKNWSSQRYHFEDAGGTPLSEIWPRTPL